MGCPSTPLTCVRLARWGIEFSYATELHAFCYQSDVGTLSVYTILVGYGVKC